MAKEEDVKSLTKAITALKQTAATTATNLAKAEAAASAINRAIGDMANIPLFKGGASAAKFLGGKGSTGAGAVAGAVAGKLGNKSTGPNRDPKTGRFIKKGVGKGDKALEKIQESTESQLQIQEGNEEEEKVERVKNDENRREESGLLVRVADGIETLVENALNPKVAEAEGGGFLAGILGMLFGSFSFGSILKKITKPFTIFKKGFLKIGTFFKSIGTKIGNIPKVMSKAFPFFKNVGGFLKGIVGKIFLPITVLMAAFDFITGFMKGYEDGGFLEGIKQGIMGVINGLVDVPLNLVKDLISWVATKLGFEGVSETLDAFTFDFAGLYGKAFDMVKTFVTETLVPYLTEVFGGMFTGISTFLTETVLPWVTGFWEGLSFGNIMETIDEFLIQPLTSMFNSIIDFFKNLELPSLEDITGMIPGFDSFKGMFGFGDDDEESTGSVVDSIVQNAEGMAMSAEELVTAIFDKIGAAGSSAAATVVSTVNNLTSGGSSTTVIPTGFDTKTDPSMGRESWISDF